MEFSKRTDLRAKIKHINLLLRPIILLDDDTQSKSNDLANVTD